MDVRFSRASSVFQRGVLEGGGPRRGKGWQGIARDGKGWQGMARRGKTRHGNKRATVLLVLSDTANRATALPSERGTCKCDVKGGANNNVWPSRISFRLAKKAEEAATSDEQPLLNKTAHY